MYKLWLYKNSKNNKKFIKKYVPNKYDEVFRSSSNANNYAAYIGKNKTSGEDVNIKKAKITECANSSIFLI